MGVAEEAIWASATECLFRTTKASSRHEIEPEIGRDVIAEIIGKFRDKYRNVLRYGILDSALDLDVVLPEKEFMPLWWQVISAFRNGPSSLVFVLGQPARIFYNNPNLLTYRAANKTSIP